MVKKGNLKISIQESHWNLDIKKISKVIKRGNFKTFMSKTFEPE